MGGSVKPLKSLYFGLRSDRGMVRRSGQFGSTQVGLAGGLGWSSGRVSARHWSHGAASVIGRLSSVFIVPRSRHAQSSCSFAAHCPSARPASRRGGRVAAGRRATRVFLLGHCAAGVSRGRGGTAVTDRADPARPRSGVRGQPGPAVPTRRRPVTVDTAGRRQQAVYRDAWVMGGWRGPSPRTGARRGARVFVGVGNASGRDEVMDEI